MKVAELFVNIGVKGADTAGKALSGVNEGMKGIISSSLAAKAAVLAVLYGLQRLTEAAGDRGAGLTQFAALTDIDTSKVQVLENILRQVGAHKEDVEATLKSIQQVTTAIQMHKGAPPEFLRMMSAVQLDPTRIKDTLYVFQKMAEYSKTVPPNIAKSMLGAIGAGNDSILAAMIRNKKDLSQLSGGNILGGQTIEQLTGVNRAWSNIGDTVEKAVQRMTAKHGFPIIKDIEELIPKVFRLADAFGKVIEKLHAIEGLSHIFSWIGDALNGLAQLTDELSGKKVSGADNEKFLGKNGALMSLLMGPRPLDADINGKNGYNPIAPSTIRLTPDRGGGDKTINSNPTINIHTESKDPEHHASVISKEIQRAVFQSTALSQVT